MMKLSLLLRRKKHVVTLKRTDYNKDQEIQMTETLHAELPKRRKLSLTYAG